MTKEKFLEEVKSGVVSPVYAEIPYAPPFQVYEAIGARPNSILLESVKGPHKIARYSFIAFDPYLVFRAKDGEVKIEVLNPSSSSVSSRPPLERLKELVAAYPQKQVPDLPPFQGGAIGLLSYDFVRYIERIPEAAKDDLQIPDAHFLLADKVVAFDHQAQKAWIIVSPGARDTELGYRDISDIDWNRAYDEAEEVIARKLGSSEG